MSSARKASSRRINLRIIGLVVLALTVFLGVLTIIGSASRSYTVAVATKAVLAGQALSADAYRMVTINGDLPTNDQGVTPFIQEEDIDSILGAVLINNVYPGSFLQKSDFFIPAKYDPANPTQVYAHRLTELLPKDGRTVVIIGDPTSTFVQAGDFVDVYAVREMIMPDGSSQKITQKMFTKRVLFAITRPIPGPEGSADYVPNGTAFGLQLNAQEAQDLIYAQSVGEIRISLSNPESVDNPQTIVTDQDYFNKTYLVTTIEPSPSPSSEPSLEPSPFASPAPNESQIPSPSTQPLP